MRDTNIEYTPDQQEALKSIKEWLTDETKPYKTLSGYAGTGKTTLLDAVVNYADYKGMSILVSATTNKAVKVLRDKIEADTFGTIHSALNIRPKKRGTKEIFEPVRFGKELPIVQYDLVVVDECSMISTQLLSIIDNEIKGSGTKVLFCGDPAQLQPINEEISQCFHFDPVLLTEVVRHGDSIAQKAKLVRSTDRVVPYSEILQDPDIVKVNGSFPEIFKGFREDPDRIRMICWRNDQVDYWNRLLREVDWDKTPDKKFQVGDIVIANEPCVIASSFGDKNIVMMNSEEGIVEKVNETPSSYELDVAKFSGGTCIVNVAKDQYKEQLDTLLSGFAKRKKWKDFWDLKESYHDIKHCYAITAHKSQGSTFQNVVIDWRDMSLNRNRENRNQLIYVGMTRASEKVMIL